MTPAPMSMPFFNARPDRGATRPYVPSGTACPSNQRETHTTGKHVPAGDASIIWLDIIWSVDLRRQDPS
eukprot:3189941-Rhodomonas_salina.1